MRIFKYRNFSKWAKEEKITDLALIQAVNEIEAGLIDANLGAGLYKKRVARQGMGKSGGYRVLLALKHGQQVFFLHGFAKNQQNNITEAEQEAYKDLARYLLSVSDSQANRLIEINEIIEVEYAKENKT